MSEGTDIFQTYKVRQICNLFQVMVMKMSNENLIIF